MGIDGGIKNEALDQISIYAEFSVRKIVEVCVSLQLTFFRKQHP